MLYYQKIRDIRKSKKISGKQMAKDLKLSESAISQFETGKSGLSMDNILSICKYLSINPDEFLLNNSVEESKGSFANNSIDQSHGSFIGNSHNAAPNTSNQLQVLALENEGLKKELAHRDELIKELRDRIEDYKERIAELKEKAK